MSSDQSEMSAALLNQISLYKKQLEANPDNYSALVNLGNSYFDLNNPSESIKYYEQALKIRPNEPEVLVDCGVMYRELGETEKAIEAFTTATRLAPGLPQAFFNLGVVILVEKNDSASAIEIWRKFLENNPEVNPEIKSFFEEKIQQARKTG
jgi:tetratricopeptide (TPR) repeat protein